MVLSDFINMCKDFLVLILYAVNRIISSLFSMPLFVGISVGHCLLAFMVFGILFGFIFGLIQDKFGK